MEVVGWRLLQPELPQNLFVLSDGQSEVPAFKHPCNPLEELTERLRKHDFYIFVAPE